MTQFEDTQMSKFIRAYEKTNERLKLFLGEKPGSLGVWLNLEVSKKQRDMDSADGESELSVIISLSFQTNRIFFQREQA